MTSRCVFFWLFPALLICGIACSKKEISYSPHGDQPPGSRYFKTSKYPGLRIDFVEGKDVNNIVKFDESLTVDTVDVLVDFSNEFSNIDVEPGTTGANIEIEFFKNDETGTALEGFKWFINEYEFFDFRETMIGNIPAFQKIGSEGFHILLIPNYYASAFFMRGCGEEHAPGYCKRYGEIEQELLRNITWEKSINTDSQEFKVWKIHILNLIQEAREKLKNNTFYSVDQLYFQDKKYPIRIDFPQGEDMSIYSDPEGHFISINKLREQFYDPRTGKRGPGNYYEFSKLVFETDVSKVRDIRLFAQHDNFYFGDYKETMVGNIPALYYVYYNSRNYFLLIPGLYSHLGCYCASDEEKRRCDTIASSIHWNQSINVNSQEFKSWKAHILNLIEEARQSAAKKK
ncbi:MAG: hypothetical protein AABZ44_06320 [Elusimicrobiota bacterium]